MEYREEVDLRALRLVRDNFETVFERMGKSLKIQGKDNVYRVVEDYKQAQTLIDDFYHAKKNTTKVKYRYSSGVNYGRRFHCSPSLQECPRPIRHAIAKDIYYDIDVKSAHPTFLLHYCKSKGWEHPVLEQYVEGDREGFLVSICQENPELSRDDAKRLVLQVLNGGGAGGSKILADFYLSQQVILDNFYYAEENLKFKKRAQKKDSTWDNKKGSALNYYLCEQENIVLQHMEEFAREHNIEVGTLCFDGMMVYKNTVSDPKEMVKSMTEYVSEKMGYELTITVKEMDEAVDLSSLEIVPNRDEQMLEEMIELIQQKTQLTHKEAAELFYCYYKEDFYFTDAGWVSWMDGQGWRIGDEQMIVYPLMKHMGGVLTEYLRRLKESDVKEEPCDEESDVEESDVEESDVEEEPCDEESESEESDVEEELPSGVSEKVLAVWEKEKEKKRKEKEKEKKRKEKEKEKKRKEKEKEKKRKEKEKERKEKEKEKEKERKEKEKEKKRKEKEGEFEKRVAMFQRVANSLETYSNMNQVVKSMAPLFYNNAILAELDTIRPELFAFSDFKAYNLTSGEIVDVKKEDKVRTNTGYPLPERNEEEIATVWEYLMSFLYPKDVEERKEGVKDIVYSFLSLMSQALFGRNAKQILGLLLGKGSNSKSAFLDLMQKVFGDYFAVIPSEQLTGQSSSKDAPSSTLMSCMGKRCVVIREPDVDPANPRPLNSGTVKEWTGEKSVKARKLRCEVVDLQITFTPFICCQIPPPFTRMDYAIERRLKPFWFPTTFFRVGSKQHEEEYDEKNEYHRLVDEEFYRKVMKHKNGLLWILLDFYTQNNGDLYITDENEDEVKATLLSSSPIFDWIKGYEVSVTPIRVKKLHEDYSSAKHRQQLSDREFNRYLRDFEDSMGFKIEIDHNHGNKVNLRKRNNNGADDEDNLPK